MDVNEIIETLADIRCGNRIISLSDKVLLSQEVYKLDRYFTYKDKELIKYGMQKFKEANRNERKRLASRALSDLYGLTEVS